jgi:NADPH:quinone reductase-like Zn-dependent oxidoreductase
MKAVRFHEHGDSSVLRYEDVPDPEAGPGDVVLRVGACALNGLDLTAREGGLEVVVGLPHIGGADFAGEVVAVGSGVEGVRAGDRVIGNPRIFCGSCEQCLRGEQSGCVDYEVVGWHRPGAYAELLSVPAANVEAIPDTLSFVDAAAVPLTFTTAWRMLYDRARLRPGETVLVLGASGGVASAAVQLARAAGARVLATTAAEKVERVAALGADEVIDYVHDDVAERVLELTGGRGVDVLVQTQGGETWRQGLDCMAWFGRVVVCSAIQGATPTEELELIWWKQLSVVGSNGGTPLDFRNVVSYLAAGTIRALVDAVYPLSAAAEAQDAFASHRHVGKIVLEP